MNAKETNAQKSFREHVEVVIRRRWFFILPLLGVAGIAVVLSYTLPRVYQASATIQINDKRIIDPITSGMAEATDARRQIDTLTKQILSYPKLAIMIKQLRLADSARSVSDFENFVMNFKKRIAIALKDANSIEVTFQDGDPLVAQKVVNTLTQSFINDNSAGKKEEARNSIDFISEQLKIYRQKLESSQNNSSARKIENDLREAQNRKRLLESQLQGIARSAPPPSRQEQGTVVGRLQMRLADLQAELSRLMIDATPENPRVAALKAEIEKVKATLGAEIRKDTARGGVGQSNPLYMQTEQELKKLNMEIAFLEQRREELADKNDQGDGPMSDDEMSTIETSKKVDEDIYQMLLKQMEAAYVSERLQDSDKGSAFRIIEYARLPVFPIKPERNKIMIFGLFLGIMSGLGGVFLMEYLDRSFRTAEDAKKLLKTQYLGSVSKIVIESGTAQSITNRMSNRLKGFIQKRKLFADLRFVSPHIVRRTSTTGIAPQIVIYHEPKSPVSEEYRIIRTNVQGLGYESDLKTVMVTSSVRGEGKSTTSANLAISLADIGKRTLLMDCDLRKGVTHEYLNISQTPGLTDVLTRNIDPEAALVTTKVKNLALLPCGTRPMNPSELLGSPGMEKLLESFGSRFDIVLLDAPPVLNLPDSRILGKNCDGVILVVQAERTQREDVQHAYAMLTQSHSNVCGFVLTNVQYYIPKYVYDYLYGT